VVVLMDLDELVGHWTLLDDERELIAGKRGPTRLGFALLLKFYARAGRFPRGRPPGRRARLRPRVLRMVRAHAQVGYERVTGRK